MKCAVLRGADGAFEALLEREARGAGDTVRIDSGIVEEILIDVQEEDGKLRAVLRPKLRDAIELGATQISDEVGGGIDFNIEDPKLAKHLREQLIRVQRINVVTRERIRNALLKGLDGGESLVEVAQRISQAMGGIESSRAYVIAQTEIHQAINAGRADSIRQAGLGKAWLTSGQPVRSRSNPKGVVRFAHKHAETMSAKGIAADADFELVDEDGNKELASQPGDPRLSPRNTINCRCTLVARSVGKAGVDAARIGRLSYRDLRRERGER